MDAQSKRQNERAKAIKLKLHREESKRMWYLIKRTVKDPHSTSVLKVQREVEGKIEEYTVQEDVEQAIQRECKVGFSLVHSAPIMNSLLGEKLRYLSDEALAKAIITGTYDIPTSLDPATAMIPKEIGKLGMKIVNGDSNEIIISPEDQRTSNVFGRKSTSSHPRQCQVCTTGITKPRSRTHRVQTPLHCS